MDEVALREHLRTTYPKENEACEWKEFKNLRHAVSGKAGSYVSAIANMSGGHLVLGVQDKTLDIVGIREFGDYTIDDTGFAYQFIGGVSRAVSCNADMFVEYRYFAGAV